MWIVELKIFFKGHISFGNKLLHSEDENLEGGDSHFVVRDCPGVSSQKPHCCRVTNFQEPEVFDSLPDVSLASKDDKHKEPSKNVAAVNDSEDDVHRVIVGARLVKVMMNNEVNTLKDPQYAENHEKLHVQNLKQNLIENTRKYLPTSILQKEIYKDGQI